MLQSTTLGHATQYNIHTHTKTHLTLNFISNFRKLSSHTELHDRGSLSTSNVTQHVTNLHKRQQYPTISSQPLAKEELIIFWPAEDKAIKSIIIGGTLTLSDCRFSLLNCSLLSSELHTRKQLRLAYTDNRGTLHQCFIKTTKTKVWTSVQHMTKIMSACICIMQLVYQPRRYRVLQRQQI